MKKEDDCGSFAILLIVFFVAFLFLLIHLESFRVNAKPEIRKVKKIEADVEEMKKSSLAAHNSVVQDLELLNINLKNFINEHRHKRNEHNETIYPERSNNARKRIM